MNDEIKRLAIGILAVQQLIDNSQGVYGLHLNGEPAPWSDLQTGGRYEGWLVEFDDAMKIAEKYS